jgi:hypothetical protein
MSEKTTSVIPLIWDGVAYAHQIEQANGALDLLSGMRWRCYPCVP